MTVVMSFLINASQLGNCEHINTQLKRLDQDTNNGIRRSSRNCEDRNKKQESNRNNQRILRMHAVEKICTILTMTKIRPILKSRVFFAQKGIGALDYG